MVLPGRSAEAAELTPQEQHGKQIFHEGRGQARIVALVGRSRARVDASVLPCASCHGPDGLGRAEGGAEPSNITWRELTKPYGHRHPNGRVHPAFDERSFAGAVTEGVDPAGTELEPVMPRYEMSAEDMAALVAYLKRLEGDLDPGLTPTTITVGSVLPRSGEYESHGLAVEAVLRAHFAELNAGGGVFGRKLDLKVADYLPDREATLANARRLIEQGQIFAALGVFAIGQEQPLFALLEESGIPQVGPFTLLAGDPDLPSRSTFYLESGLSLQASALAEFAAGNLGLIPSGVAVLVTANEAFGDIAGAVEDRAQAHGWPRPLVIRDAVGGANLGGLVGQLALEGVDTVFHFGATREFRAFAIEAGRQGWRPRLFLSGLLAGEASLDLPPVFAGRAFVAYPSLPSDYTPDGRAEFEALHRKHRLSSQHLALQASAYAAAKVFVEGLRRAGRSLSRATLVAAVEGLSDFETGLTRPVTLGPERHIGVRGAYVLTIDPLARAFRPDPVWISLDKN
ncbi:MAG TPA: ABC transporter substrate-binding protein [Geminicoccaceae bacterium]|nr:ABC transporter substrate-binding protein [Geminicoccaceae bacterium]